MSTATLINHRGGRDLSRDELATIEAPPATSTWYPIPHRQVLDSVWETLLGAGFEITASRCSVSNGGARFFGTLDLKNRLSDASGGVSLAVGVTRALTGRAGGTPPRRSFFRCHPTGFLLCRISTAFGGYVHGERLGPVKITYG